MWLSTCIPYQLNIVSDYAITQNRTNASEIAHLVRIVCSGLNPPRSPELTGAAIEAQYWQCWVDDTTPAGFHYDTLCYTLFIAVRRPVCCRRESYLQVLSFSCKCRDKSLTPVLSTALWRRSFAPEQSDVCNTYVLNESYVLFVNGFFYEKYRRKPMFSLYLCMQPQVLLMKRTQMARRTIRISFVYVFKSCWASGLSTT